MYIVRALDKGAYLMIIFLFLIETICCDPNLNRLVETVQMRGHNICFYAELIKIIHNYHQIHPLIYSSVLLSWELQSCPVASVYKNSCQNNISNNNKNITYLNAQLISTI